MLCFLTNLCSTCCLPACTLHQPVLFGCSPAAEINIPPVPANCFKANCATDDSAAAAAAQEPKLLLDCKDLPGAPAGTSSTT